MITSSVTTHEIKLEGKSIEEIISERMKTMSMINNLSQKIYKQLNKKDFNILKDNSTKLKHTASEFKKLFPVNSEGGKAKKLVWVNKKLFNEYNDNFIKDINSMIIDIDANDIVSLKKNFNSMAANCSSCHKKFKNKK